MQFFFKTIVPVLILSLGSFSGFANLYDKSRGGINYSLAIRPAVSRIIGGKTNLLAHFHRAGLSAEVPYNRYLLFGFGIDYTLLISAHDGDPRLNRENEVKKISTTFLGAHGLIKTQYPLALNFADLSIYTGFLGGIGVSTPITMGTQPLSDYKFPMTRNFPSPFPLYLETTLMGGVEVFFSEFIGVDLGVGYRTLWIVHPMVNSPRPGAESRPKDARSAIWYDVSSLFIDLGLKMTF